jgi:hypothetical protein
VRACLSTVMPGFMPGIHVLKKALEQILPFRILAVNQPYLICARPMFDRLLALNGHSNVVVLFEIDEPVETVPLC